MVLVLALAPKLNLTLVLVLVLFVGCGGGTSPVTPCGTDRVVHLCRLIIRLPSRRLSLFFFSAARLQLFDCPGIALFNHHP